MDRRYPHDIKRFAEGENLPETFTRLTNQEAKKLDRMSPFQRRMWLKNKAPGRNAPCKCGSGKKFKRCCA